MGTTGVRGQLIAAALEEIREHGWEATSMQRVRERAGVSNGSLFHYFPSRADLEAAVLNQALIEHQATVLGILRRSRSARSGIRNVVRGQVEWIAANPGLAMLLLTALPEVLREQITSAPGENVEFFEEVAGWFRAHGWNGNPELFVLLAIWVGPTNELARNRISRGAGAPAGAVVNVLADAAWRALSPYLREEEF